MAIDIIQTPKPEAVAEAITIAAPKPAAGCEQYRPLLEQYAGWNVDTMLYAMEKESTTYHGGVRRPCDPLAVGDDYPIAGVHAPSCGLLQVRTIDPARGTCEQLKDPAYNIASAYRIWQQQGYRAWTTLH